MTLGRVFRAGGNNVPGHSRHAHAGFLLQWHRAGASSSGEEQEPLSRHQFWPPSNSLAALAAHMPQEQAVQFVASRLQTTKGTSMKPGWGACHEDAAKAAAAEDEGDQVRAASAVLSPFSCE